MTDAIVQWLLSAGEGKFLAAVLISMLPVIELRGGLPAGVAMGLPLREAFFAALLGNLLPVPFIILFARRGFACWPAPISRASGAGSTGSSGRPGARATRSCAIRRGGCCSSSPCRCPARAREPAR